MTWTPKQIDAAHVSRNPYRTPGSPALSDSEVVAIMDSARDALAANGGTMMAAEFDKTMTQVCDGNTTFQDAQCILEHAAAQGSKVAVLEAHLRTCNYAKAQQELEGVRENLAATEAERKRLAESASVTECMAARRERDEARADVKRLTREREEALDRAAHAELARLKPSGQVAEDVALLMKAILGKDYNPGEAQAALSRLAAPARRGQEAEATRDAYRDSLIEAAHLEMEWAFKDGNSPGYNNQKARNYGRIGYEQRMRADAAESQLRAIRECAVKASAELRHAYRPETRDWNLVARAIRILEEVTTPNAPHRPCSPTCTAHDEDGKALEGVREQGGTVPELCVVREEGWPKDEPIPEEMEADPKAPCDVCAVVTSKLLVLCDGCANKEAEAMRAACWEAVQAVLASEGLSMVVNGRIKAAIDGATPS